MTPLPEERRPSPNANPDNYGIDDVHTDDSSEDESKPKKMVPLWAQCKCKDLVYRNQLLCNVNIDLRIHVFLTSHDIVFFTFRSKTACAKA